MHFYSLLLVLAAPMAAEDFDSIRTKMTFMSTCSVSPNGQYVAVTSPRAQQLQVYDIGTRERAGASIGLFGARNQSGFKPLWRDDESLIVVNRIGSVIQYTLSTNSSEILVDRACGSQDRTFSGALSDDGDLLAVGTEFGVHIIDLAQREKLRFIRTPGWVQSLDFGIDSQGMPIVAAGLIHYNHLARRVKRHVVHVYAVASGEPVAALGTEKSLCGGVSISFDDSKLVYTQTDGRMSICNTDTWTEEYSINASSVMGFESKGLRFHAPLFISADVFSCHVMDDSGQFGCLVLYDVRQQRVLYQAKIEKTKMMEVQYSSLSNLLVTSHGHRWDGVITLWPLPEGLLPHSTVTVASSDGR